MIVSHKHRFIFIKTRKTAGTSLEVALSGLCGPEDIVTEVRPPVPGHIPRNHSGFSGHNKSSDIKSQLPDEQWDKYFKFCFERNSYDKSISAYKWRRTQSGFKDSFTVFCIKSAWNLFSKKNRLPCRLRFDEKIYELPVDKYHYTIDGSFSVDFVGRFENIQEDFSYALSMVGITTPIVLPTEKSSRQHRESKEAGEPRYGFLAKLLVWLCFRWEISHFGYKPSR